MATEDKRGGKHKSITSETSLLGHEEAGNDNEDGRRRHRSGNSSTAGGEKARLLPDDSLTPRGTALPASKYDSDSGAESRNSSDDHDYASVEGGSGGSAEEGGGDQPRTAGQGGAHIVARSGYVSENQAVMLEPAHKQQHQQPGWKTLEHKPAPSHAPPPRPSSSSRITGYSQASLVPAVHTTAGGGGGGVLPPAVAALSSFKPLQAQKAERSPRGQHHPPPPAQLTVALEPLQSARATTSLSSAPTSGGYAGTEDPTLPRRPPATRPKGYVAPNLQDTTSFTTPSVDPYASTSLTAFSSAHDLPPSPAPPPYCAHPGKGPGGSAVPTHHPPPGSRAAPAARGYAPHCAPLTAAGPALTYSSGSTSSYCSDDSRLSADRCRGGREGEAEPIYSPPWGSNDITGLAPFVSDNRPLSEYMLRLPQNFFGSTQHVDDGRPTTEL